MRANTHSHPLRQHVSSTYPPKIRSLAQQAGVAEIPGTSAGDLRPWVDSFLVSKGYRYVRPRERNIVSPIFARGIKAGVIVDGGNPALKSDGEAESALASCGDAPFLSEPKGVAGEALGG